MYLIIKKSHGYRYLLLIEETYVAGSSSKKKVVRNFGNYDKLPDDIKKQYEDPKLRKALALKYEQETRLEDINKSLQNTREVSAVIGTDAVKTTSIPYPINHAFALRYGHLALKQIWEHELGLKYKINYLQKKQTDINTWLLNDLLFYLASSRLINAKSYLQSSIGRADYLYCPWSNVSQDNFYRALDFIFCNKDELFTHAVKSRLRNKNYNIKVAFFDCTNTWFETPYDDLTWLAIKYGRETRERLQKEGYSDAHINNYMSTDIYRSLLTSHLEEHSSEVLRMRGPSKEGRFSQPIVSVALAIDETGFPIDCNVFSGNVSELHQVEPIINDLKVKYDVKDLYFVADRGLNSTENLNKIYQKGLGFIVAQKVSQQKDNIRAEMLDLEGYHNCTFNNEGKLELSLSKDLDSNSYRFKVCDFKKTAYVPVTSGETTPSGRPKKKKVTVDCKIVYIFNPERKARDLADLNEMKIKAQNAVNKGLLLSASYTGWRALVKTQRDIDASDDLFNEGNKDHFKAIDLKEDVIKNREAIAGYSAIVFSHPNSIEDAKLTDVQVLDTYHKLVNIEDSFRVMKSSFSIRPVHVRLMERISGHCYLCILSLMMMRILQEKVSEAGYDLSSQRISQALADALAVPLDNGKFLNVRTTSRFHSPELTQKSYGESGINELLNDDMIANNFMNDQKACIGDTNLVLQAAGLDPLSKVFTLNDFRRCMKLVGYATDKLIAKEHLRLINSDHL